jgi:hypothetical protein
MENQHLQAEEVKDTFYNKSGQTQGAVGAVIGLIVGVGVAVLILIFVGVLGGQAYNIAESQLDAISGTIYNESFTATNNTMVMLAHHALDTNSLAIVNGSNYPIGLSNFTVNYNAGTIVPVFTTPEGVNFSGDTLYASYTFGDPTMEASIKNSITQGFGALEDTGTYLPLIVLGIVIFIILGLVLGMTAFGGGNGGMGSAL